MRIPAHLLEHRVVVEALRTIPRSDGAKYMPPRRVAAIVVEKRKLVTDQREGSTTKGQELQSSAQVLVQPEERVPLGSRVTIWPGSSNESVLTSLSEAYGEHSVAPSSYQMWLV